MSHDEILAKRLAGMTLADIRTVRKVLRGDPVRGVVGQKIQEALDSLRAQRVRDAARASKGS